MCRSLFRSDRIRCKESHTDKPATIALQFDKVNYTFWSKITDHADKKYVFPLTDSVLVILPVKSYSLADHQFIHIGVNVDKGREVQLWIPRNFVKMIAQGKTDLSAAFSFAGG
jgi:hypothetical protein